MEQPSTPEPKWEALPRYINEEVQRVAQTIDAFDDDGADEAVLRLNMLFEREAVMGLTAKVKLRNALIMEELISDAGISHAPVFDREVLLKKSASATFTGCENFYIENGERRELAYTFSFQENERNFVATVPAPSEQVTFEFPEIENDEAFVYKAFSVLESTNDPGYNDIVMLLKDEYEENDDDAAARLRAIGRCATELMNLPVHITKQEYMQALHSILMHSFDDAHYFIGGHRVEEEFNEETADSHLQVSAKRANSQGSLYDIVYISNFSIESEHDAEQIQVKMHPGLQPAVRFTLDNNDLVTYPIKHIDHIQLEEEALPECLDFNNKVRRYLYG